MNETFPSTGFPQMEESVAASSTQTRVQETAKSALKKVEQNPLAYVIGAFVFGIAVGMAIPKHQPTMRERYLDEPLDEIKDMLGRLTSIVQDRTSDAYDSAESKASSLFSGIGSTLRRLWS